MGDIQIIGKELKKYGVYIVLPVAFLVLAVLLGFSQKSNPEISSSSELVIEKRVSTLLKQMTLDEKIGQLVQYSGYGQLTGPGVKDIETQRKHDQLKNGRVGSMLNVHSVKDTREAQKLVVENSRLGIPLLFGYDVIHGYKTIFPIPLAETASWDMSALEKSAKIAAKEAASAGLHWTFAPMVDISRDARWGRIMEGSGEDTYLTSQAAIARVNGFQGLNLSDKTTIAACAKHFAGNGFAEAGREYNTADVSKNTLHNIILPPFKACVDNGVATVMNAFNEIGGVPSTASSYLQRDILKGKWGFDGFVVSDWGSIYELITHGVAANREDAAQYAITAGSDMDMEGYCYESNLESLVEQGKIDLRQIDDAVERVLRIKYKLGIMDDPYKYCDEKFESETLLAPEHLKAARDIGRKSIVLLKNNENILPLSNTIKSIGVIGPLAADNDSPLGNWRAQGIANSAVSLLDGIKNAVTDQVKIKYAKGCDLVTGPRTFHNEITINQNDKSLFGEAIQVAKNSEVVILALGEDSYQTGEARSQVDIRLSGVQMDLFKEINKVNNNIIIVLMNGRPLEITELAENASTIVEAWHLGSEAGNSIADVLFGKYNPSGKLPVCFPRHVGQIPLYYSQKATGRGTQGQDVFWSHYTDESNDPLFPFGFGLSYTSFGYSDIKLSSNTLEKNLTISASISLINKGKMAGEEVVQLYIQDMVGSTTRPIKELKGFQKIFLQPGESKKVEFIIDSEMLSFYTINEKWEAEPGRFKAFIGTNSIDTKQIDFELLGEG